MKKLIALLLLVVVLCTMLCACSKFTCDGCKEEVTGKKYTVEVLGEEYDLCKDCYNEVKDFIG